MTSKKFFKAIPLPMTHLMIHLNNHNKIKKDHHHRSKRKKRKERRMMRWRIFTQMWWKLSSMLFRIILDIARSWKKSKIRRANATLWIFKSSDHSLSKWNAKTTRSGTSTITWTIIRETKRLKVLRRCSTNSFPGTVIEFIPMTLRDPINARTRLTILKG